MEKILNKLLGPYFLIVFLALTAVIFYVLAILINKFRDMLPNNIENISIDNEKVILIKNRQSPHISSVILISFCSLIILIFTYNSNFNQDLLPIIFFSLLFLFGFYFFIRVFFITLIITDKRIFYKDLFDVNYKQLSLTEIKEVNLDYSKYGTNINLIGHNNSRLLKIYITFGAKKIQKTITELIMPTKAFENLENQRKLKEKKDLPKNVLIVIVVIILFALRFVYHH